MEMGVAGEVVGARSRGPLRGGGWGLNEKEAAALTKVLVVWMPLLERCQEQVED